MYPPDVDPHKFTLTTVLNTLETFKETPNLNKFQLYLLAFVISEAMRFEIVEDMTTKMIDNPSLEINWNDWHPLLKSYSDILKDKYSGNYAKEPCLIKNEDIQTFIDKNSNLTQFKTIFENLISKVY